MNYSGALAGGVIGAIVSTAAWLGIGYATGYELGILAVAVGICCGIGVALGTQGRAGTQGGIIAACCALLAIVVARYALVQISINQMIAEAAADSGDIPGSEDDEFWTAYLADRIVREREEAGQEIHWPEDEESYEDDLASNDYPSDIWMEAQTYWSRMSGSDRDRFCELGRTSILRSNTQDAEDFRGVASIIGVLIANLHPIALVLMALSVGTAFKVARDSKSKEAPLAESSFTMPADTMPNAALPQLPTTPQMHGQQPATTRYEPGTCPSTAPVPGAHRHASRTAETQGETGVTGLPGMPPPTTAGPRKFHSGGLNG